MTRRRDLTATQGRSAEMTTIVAQSLTEAGHWTEVCRRYMTDQGDFIKVAELGGDGQDVPFEQAFSNLAHAYLRDKAPSLLDHELGFQLLDRNQENTKAVGVLAFKVGSHQLFAPVFFLSGDLKGHELLYLKNQDMFVPLKENWLNYILNRKPNILGAGVSRQTSTMGVMQPDLNRLSQSPYKYAAATLPSVRPFLPKYAHLCTSDFREALSDFTKHANERLDLGDFVKQASLPALNALVDTLRRRPKLAQAYDTWHGLGELREAIKQAGVRLRASSVLDDPYRQSVPKYQQPPISGSVVDWLEKEAADSDNGPDAKQKVKITTLDTSTVGYPDDVDEEDAEKLLQDEILIKDHREGDEVSVAYNVQVEQKLTNPTETGVYMVLTKPGEFEKCLIITHPHGANGRHHHCVVVALEGEKSWCNCPCDDVWVTGQVDETDERIPGGEESWKEWFDEQSDASLSDDAHARFLIVGPRRNGTCPFRVEKTIGTGDSTVYEVDFSDNCEYGRHLSKGLHRYHDTADYEWFDEYDKWRDGQRVHMDAKIGTDLRSNHGDLYVPKGCKVIKIQETEGDKWRREDKKNNPPGMMPMSGGNDSSETPLIQPGNLMDAELSIMKKTAALSIQYDGYQYFVNESPGINAVDSLVHLVRDHGFREETSRHMMKLAEQQYSRLKPEPFRCRVKYAEPYMTDEGPSAPAIPEPDMGGYNPMGWPGPTLNGQAEEYVVDDMQAANTDPSVYNVNPANMPDPMDVNAVNQAASTGQKEVFDTAMIGSMLRAVRDDTMIDRYLPDLVKGMDRLGRILFMFYWHQDQFADRYGKQDLPELEDSLRNAFEMLGDVILFLKQKTIEPYPEEDVSSLDLGDAAEV